MNAGHLLFLTLITEDKREKSVLGCPMSEAVFQRPESWKVVEDYVCPGCAAAALHHQEVAKEHMSLSATHNSGWFLHVEQSNYNNKQQQQQSP